MINLTYQRISSPDKCMDWCVSELNKMSIYIDTSGAILIIISIFCLMSLVFDWPEGYEKYKLEVLWFSIYLLFGFLIYRLWFI